MAKSFQVQIFESGAIVFTYGTMDGTVNSPNGGQIRRPDDPVVIGVWVPR